MDGHQTCQTWDFQNLAHIRAPVSATTRRREERTWTTGLVAVATLDRPGQGHGHPKPDRRLSLYTLDPIQDFQPSSIWLRTGPEVWRSAAGQGTQNTGTPGRHGSQEIEQEQAGGERGLGEAGNAARFAGRRRARVRPAQHVAVQLCVCDVPVCAPSALPVTSPSKLLFRHTMTCPAAHYSHSDPGYYKRAHVPQQA